MIQVRRAEERGRTRLDWLDSYHTFSFGEYDDPRWRGFRSLLVLNDDTVAPGGGFGPHPHRDMEILTYVVDGALEHRDSLGNGGVIRAGDVQRMSAGTGIVHAEYNASKTHPLRFLQIWILPERQGLPPNYEQRHFPESARRDRLCLVAAPGGEGGSLTLHQDARVYASLLSPGASLQHNFEPGRHGWVQVVRGEVEVNGTPLAQGDGAALVAEPSANLASPLGAEFLLFDLA